MPEALDSQAGREVVNAGAERKLTAGRDPSVGSRGETVVPSLQESR